MAEIEMDVQTQASTTTPASGAVTLAFDSADNAPFIKTPAGTVQKFSTTTPLADRTAQQMYVVTDYGISPANSGTANVTAFNALYAAIPVNSTIYFPPGTYDFASELTMNRNVQPMIRGAGKSRSILRTTSATANLFNISISAYYYTIEELGFASSVTRTAGAYITTNVAAGDNAYLDLRRCEFKGYFVGVDLQGVGAGNVGTISECLWNTPATNAIGLRYNGANINAMVQNCTINQSPGSSGTGQCVEINQTGAVQFDNCDFVGGSNTLRVNATGTVSALQFTNCYFDQAASTTVLFTGSGAVSRVKFIGCGITNGNVTNSTAVSIAGSGTGTAIPEAIDFTSCDFYNAFGSGITTTGISVTGARGVSLTNCRVAGFTTGLSFTPYNANSITSFDLNGCTIGPTENFPGNGTGVLINAGSFTFAPSVITGCDLAGNTTPLTNNGNFDNGQLVLADNLGLPVAGLATAPNLLLATAATAVRAGNPVVVPANSIRPGQVIRFTVNCTNVATASGQTITLRFGTANTNADAAVVTLAPGAAAAGAIGGATIEGTLFFNSATTATATLTCLSTGGFATVAGLTQASTTAQVTIANTALSYAGLYISPSAANAVTIRGAAAEVIQ